MSFYSRPLAKELDMYQLLHSLTASELFRRQLPSFAVAFAVAELLYKFKSFALECAAFLVTWYILDWLLSALFPAQTSPKATDHAGPTA